MEEGIDKLNGNEASARDDIYSKAIKAGRRTYFFDVKATKQNDYYLTITESKRRMTRDGRYYYEKHKIFLYKEDFEKFIDGLNEMVDFIKTSNPIIITDDNNEEFGLNEDFATVDFEDLEEEKQ